MRSSRAQSAEAPSGVALVMVGGGGENLIAVAPGANAELLPGQVEAAAGVIERAEVVVAQLEIPLESVQTAARLARQAGRCFLLNAAPVIAGLEEVLGLTTLLVVNESELSGLAGRGGALPTSDQVAAARAGIFAPTFGSPFDLARRTVGSAYVVARAQKPAALGRDIVDDEEHHAASGDFVVGGKCDSAPVGELPLHQRGHRPVIFDGMCLFRRDRLEGVPPTHRHPDLMLELASAGRRLIDEPKTLEDLSQVYGVSRERIRQIEVRAFEKLQAALIRLAGEQRLLPAA